MGSGSSKEDFVYRPPESKGRLQKGPNRTNSTTSNSTEWAVSDRASESTQAPSTWPEHHRHSTASSAKSGYGPSFSQTQSLRSVLSHQSVGYSSRPWHTVSIASDHKWPRSMSRDDLALSVTITPIMMQHPKDGNMPCWQYVSHGIAAVNQPELVFVLRRRLHNSDEDYPMAPVEWMRMVYQMASLGVHTEAFTMCHLGFDDIAVHVKTPFTSARTDLGDWADFGLFGALVHIVPVCYVQGLATDLLPSHYHFVVGLTHKEVDVVQEVGITRVLSQVGFFSQTFPYPVYVDRDRADFCSVSGQQGSVRLWKNMSTVRISGTMIKRTGNSIVLSLPSQPTKRAFLEDMIKKVPNEAILLIEGYIAPDAASGYLWSPMQKKLIRYGEKLVDEKSGTENSNLAFMMIYPNQKRNYCDRSEDGYVFHFHPQTWQSILLSIRHHQSIIVPVTNTENRSIQFQLVWQRNVYHNPIDGQDYSADVHGMSVESDTTTPRPGSRPQSPPLYPPSSPPLSTSKSPSMTPLGSPGSPPPFSAYSSSRSPPQSPPLITRPRPGHRHSAASPTLRSPTIVFLTQPDGKDKENILKYLWATDGALEELFSENLVNTAIESLSLTQTQSQSQGTPPPSANRNSFSLTQTATNASTNHRNSLTHIRSNSNSSINNPIQRTSISHARTGSSASGNKWRPDTINEEPQITGAISITPSNPNTNPPCCHLFLQFVLPVPENGSWLLLTGSPNMDRLPGDVDVAEVVRLVADVVKPQLWNNRVGVKAQLIYDFGGDGTGRWFD